MYKAAVQVISFAIQIETLNNDLHKQSTLYELRGSFFTRLREFDAALLDYNKAAQLDPENATLLYDIGNVYFLSGNYSVAPFFFTASLSENLSSKLSQTHRCKAYMLLGCCRLSTKEYSLAITALAKSIEVTDSAAVHNLQGVSLFLSGDKQRASDEFQRALELDPAVSAYHCNRGVCCFLLKNTEDALMNFSNAILNHPSRDEVLLWYRGVAQLVCDALSQAHVDLDESISLSPLPEFLLTKALVYFAEGNFSACQTFAKEALDASCGDGGKNMVEYRATFLLGVLAHTEERWYDALDCYLAAVKGDSSLRCAYYLVGLVYFKLKNYDVAIKYFDICISISPEIPLYYLHKGVAQVLSGNPYGGLQAFKTLQHDKQLPYDIVCYVRSRALLELNQHEEALEWVNQAIELESGQHQYYLSRAEILFNLDRFEACVEDIQSVERLNDKVGEAYYLKGRAYQARGLFSEALEAFNKARDCSPVLSDTPAFATASRSC
ncbi:superkiller protein 3 [Angomonas deanei]|nr:superkiller protein 3 [Angomonas deanei]|eukprot:EPY37337.1 superkiller protein 3 [Angomonas deanei]